MPTLAPHYAARSTLLPSEPSADESAAYAPREDCTPAGGGKFEAVFWSFSILSNALFSSRPAPFFLSTDAPRPQSEDCVVRITANGVRPDAESSARTSDFTLPENYTEQGAGIHFPTASKIYMAARNRQEELGAEESNHYRYSIMLHCNHISNVMEEKRAEEAEGREETHGIEGK